MVLRHMPNSVHGGPHMTQFRTIFVFFVSPAIPNIEKFQLYEVYKSLNLSLDLSLNQSQT